MHHTAKKIHDHAEQLSAEMEKFEKGNASAGTRARKLLQDIKIIAGEARKEIQNKKNAE